MVSVPILLLVAAAAAPQPEQPLFHSATSRSLDEFAACFVRAQDRQEGAWAFLRAENGGTFTNFGIPGASNAYWLRLRLAGLETRISVFGDGPVVAENVLQAVERCR